MTVKQKADASKGVGTSKRTTKLKARSYGKKAVNFLLTLVMVISLCFSSGLTALADGVNDTAADQGIATQVEESTETTQAEEAIDTTTPGEGVGEEAVGSEEAAELEQPDAGVAAVAAATGIAPMSEEGEGGIMPMASSVHFTKLELHEGSPTGALVANLLNPASLANVDWQVESEYYLVAEVTKDAAADECWVSIDLPYWMRAINMVGGNSWRTTGATVDHTAIDQVVSFTANTGSTAYDVKSGKVYYHIKNTTNIAGFQCSFSPDWRYFNGDTANGQPVTTEKLSFACGDMNGAVIGDTAETKTINQITKTSTSYGKVVNHNDTPTTTTKTSVDAENTSSYLAVGTADISAVWTEAEFDLTYSQGIDLKQVNLLGTTATAVGSPTVAGGKITQHYKVSNPDGSVGNRTKIVANFPDSMAETRQDFVFSNVTANTYGDENNYWRPGDVHTTTFNVTNEITWNLAATSPYSAYDYHAQGIDTVNEMLGFAYLSASGDKTLSTNPLTVKMAAPANAVVREVVIPHYEGSSNSVIINGQTYDIADIAYQTGSNCYVIRNTDIGLGIDQSITSVQYDVGKMPGSSSTVGSINPVVSYGSTTFQFKGYCLDASPMQLEFEAWETGDVSTLKTASQTTNPINAAVAKLTNNATMSKTAFTAGDSTHVKWPVGINASINGNEVDTVADPVYFLFLPEGVSFANASIQGVPVSGEDVTASASGVPAGTTVYKLHTTANVPFGHYLADGSAKNGDIEFDLITEKSMNAETFQLGDILQVGSMQNLRFSNAYIDTETRTDQYSVNRGYDLVAPKVTFSVQELKAVTVDNSMKVTSNGQPLNTELVYNAGDPNGTRAFVQSGFAADYKVNVKNQTGETAADVKVYIPVPKAGQNFGAAFNPDGAQEFDLKFQDTSHPVGWTVEYVKMNPGFTADNATDMMAITPADYTASDPDHADMVIINGPSMGDATEAEFHFNVTGDASALGAINTWNCYPVYTVGTTTSAPQGYPEALEVAQGKISGTVYDDKNGNGVQDSGELGIAGVTVTAQDNFKLSDGSEFPRTDTATTDTNGNYEFNYVRNTAAAGLKNESIAVTITVTNPDSTNMAFSPTTTSGNKPSVVTAASDNTSAAKTGIQLKTGNTAEAVDAGLLSIFKVTYKAGSNGTINGATTDVNEKVNSGQNPAHVPATAADAGYTPDGWTANVAVTLKDGTTIAAGSKITDAQVSNIVVTSDLTLTAKFLEQKASVVKTLKSVTNGGQVGGEATYEITVTNLGTAELNGYKVTEAPEGLTITGVTGTDVAWDADTKTITFNKVAASSGTKTATVVCKIDAVPFTNSVEPEVKTGDYGITKTRVTDKTGATAATATDLIYPGDTVYYKLELTNGATAIAAAGIDITDTATNLSDGKLAADDSAFSGTWNTGAVAVNGTASVVIKYTANTGVDYVSNAAVAPNGKNSVVTDPVQRTDKLDIDKKLDTTDAVGVGDEVQYTITVKNDGTNAVNGAKITEQPVGLTITSVTGTGVTWVDPDITIASIAAGGTATITVKATVTATSFANGIVNPGPDPTEGLTLDKIRCDATGAAATDKIMAGDTVYYKLSIENTGDTTIAAGKEVTDTFSGLTYVGTEGTVSGTVEADGSKWTAPAVNVGDTASVILKFTVKDDAKLATNTAKCDGQIKVVTDKVIGDEQKDVTVTKTLTTTGTIEIGDTVSYTITAKNNGTNNLTSVVLDEQPVGLTNLAITAPTTGVALANNQITIDKLDAGATATITLTADVTAEIFTNGLVNPISDFTLDKVRTDADGNATANTVAEGDTVYYLISITNTGDVVLPAKTVTDTLSGLTFVSAAGDGTMSADGTTWTTPADLAIGATASTLVTATVTAESGSIITNTATCEGQTKVVSDIVSIYDVNAEGFGMTSATAIAIFGNSTDPMDLAGASYNNVSATTDGNPATGFSQVIDPADWAAIQAGTPGTYYVTYSNDDNLAGTTTITVPIVIGNDIENGDYKVSAQDVTLSSTAAKLALGSSTDTMDLAAAAYNNAAAETKTNGVWAPTTNISNSVDPADWTAIKAGTKGDYPVAYYNDDDATGVTKYVALVSIGNTPASEYKVDATSITLTPDAAILAFGTSTDPTDLMGPLYNKVSAQTFNGVAWSDTTNISQVIDPADWAAIQAGTPGTYYVTYVNDDDPSGNTKKVVSVVVDEWGILDTGITAHNFDYATGISSPTITDAIARQLADAAGYDDNGVPIAANQIIPDVAQLAAINAAKDAGLTGSYPLALVNSVTGEVANIVVTLTGEPKITLTKTVSTDKAAPGDTVVYTITASNDSEVLATGVWTKDIVPENTTFVSCDALGSHESANGQEYVSWFATEIEPGDSITYTMKVTVNECQDGTGVKNIALYEVTGSDTEPTDLSGTPTGGVSNEVEFTVNSSAAYAKTSKLAKTGDDMSLMVIALGFASLVCAAGALGLRRRRQY